MKLPTCAGCGRPVLELAGQFEKLDSYYLEAGGPPAESAGWWHASCLADSSHGGAWYAARLHNHVAIRGFEGVARTRSWTVVRNPRDQKVLALGRTGELLGLGFGAGRPRPVSGGRVHRVAEEYCLEVDEPDVVAAVQEAAGATTRFPLSTLVEALGISDRILHPEALEGGLFRCQRWPRGEPQTRIVVRRVEYGVFVPAELEPYVARTR